jgi:hypothetical protein
VAGALKAAREGGDRGSISRLWYRMESVRSCIERLKTDGGEWEGEMEMERKWVSTLLREDGES